MHDQNLSPVTFSGRRSLQIDGIAVSSGHLLLSPPEGSTCQLSFGIELVEDVQPSAWCSSACLACKLLGRETRGRLVRYFKYLSRQPWACVGLGACLPVLVSPLPQLLASSASSPCPTVVGQQCLIVLCIPTLSDTIRRPATFSGIPAMAELFCCNHHHTPKTVAQQIRKTKNIQIRTLSHLHSRHPHFYYHCRSEQS